MSTFRRVRVVRWGRIRSDIFHLHTSTINLRSARALETHRRAYLPLGVLAETGAHLSVLEGAIARLCPVNGEFEIDRYTASILQGAHNAKSTGRTAHLTG